MSIDIPVQLKATKSICIQWYRNWVVYAR